MNATPSLSALVETAVERHQTSVRQLSVLAHRQGFKVTHTTLNQVRSGTYKSAPSEVTIRAIAWLAGVDASVAFTAAGQTVPGPPFAEELPAGVDNLPPKMRKAAIDMLRTLVDLNEDANAIRKERAEWLESHGYVRAEPQPDVPETEESLAAKRRAGELIEDLKASGRGNAGPGQKTHLAAVPDTVAPIDDDALDRLHQERWQDLAAKKAHGGISHDQNPEDT